MTVRSRGGALAAAISLLLLSAATSTPAGATITSANDPGLPQQWALSIIGAPQAWTTATGRGITIAIVDTGVNLQHPDLTDRLVAGWDFVDDDANPDDEEGHGTHVAGIAAATADNGRGVAGVAPDARIMPIRVLDENGTGSTADVTAGVRWAVDHGADVVNLSLGSTASALLGTSLDDAVRYAWDRGALAVVAAGNDYVLGSGFADEPAIVVAATTVDDTAPDYSNGVGAAQWGMSAPGGGTDSIAGSSPPEDDILSTAYIPGQGDDSYGFLQGTSMAAPHVSGAAAVLMSMGLDAPDAVRALLDTAHDLGSKGRDSTFGAGRLDLAAAVASSRTSAGPAPTTATTRPTPPTAPSPTTTAPSPTPSVASSDDGLTTPSTSPGGGDAGAATDDPASPDTTADPTDSTGERQVTSEDLSPVALGDTTDQSDRTVPLVIASVAVVGVAVATARLRRLPRR